MIIFFFMGNSDYLRICDNRIMQIIHTLKDIELFFTGDKRRK